MKLNITTTFISFALLTIVGCSGTQQMKQSDSMQYNTKFSHHDRSIAGYNIDNYTNAPLQIVKMVHLNVPTQQAFDLVATGIHRWFDGIPELVWDHSKSSTGDFGPGSSRTCEFEGDTLVERIPIWENGKIYAYQIDTENSTASFPMSDHIGIFIIEEDGAGGSVVTWRQYFNRNIHLMSPVLAWMLDTKFMTPALENLANIAQGSLLVPNVYPEL